MGKSVGDKIANFRNLTIRLFLNLGNLAGFELRKNDGFGSEMKGEMKPSLFFSLLLFDNNLVV